MAGLTWRKDDLSSALVARIEITVMDDHLVRVIFSVNFEDSSYDVHS